MTKEKKQSMFEDKEDLQKWIARRKKCCTFRSKKDYNRQEERKKEKDYAE